MPTVTVPQTTPPALMDPDYPFPFFESDSHIPGSFQWTDGLEINNAFVHPLAPTLVSPSPESRVQTEMLHEQSMGSVMPAASTGSGFHQPGPLQVDYQMMLPGPPPHLGLGHSQADRDSKVNQLEQRIAELLKENTDLKKDNMIFEARYTTILYVYVPILTDNLN